MHLTARRRPDITRIIRLGSETMPRSRNSHAHTYRVTVSLPLSLPCVSLANRNTCSCHTSQSIGRQRMCHALLPSSSLCLVYRVACLLLGTGSYLTFRLANLISSHTVLECAERIANEREHAAFRLDGRTHHALHEHFRIVSGRPLRSSLAEQEVRNAVQRIVCQLLERACRDGGARMLLSVG